MWEFIAFIILLLGWKMSCKKIGQWNESPWSLSTAKAIQGISAICIVLHHASQKLLKVDGNAGALKDFKNFGVLFVGIFFFFSGFGLMKSYYGKSDYFKHFFRNRFSSLCIPFFISNLIYYIVVSCLGRKLPFKEVILALIGYHPINDQIWFVVEIAIFYLVFYLLFRFTKHEKLSLLGMYLFLIAFIAYCLTRGHGKEWFQGEWWYNTSLLFGIGMTFGMFEGNILKFFKKTYVILLPISLIATYVFYRMNIYNLNNVSYWSEEVGNPAYKDKLTCLSTQVPMIIFFVIAILLITLKIQIGNPILQFLGKRSLEIYLIQNLFLTYLRSTHTIVIKNDDLYVAAVLICTIVAAFLLHILDAFLIGKIRKK